MPSLCLYFQIHQPHRLRKYSYFDIGHNDDYFDDLHNQAILKKVAEKCYLPANQCLLKLIQQHEGQFKVAFSISGTAIEQFKQFYPAVLNSFRELVNTGCVEILNETYNHSLSVVFSKDTFIQEIKRHRHLIRDEFDYQASTFRNTELIYSNEVAHIAAQLGYKTILAEGADKILQQRSPNYRYQTATSTPLTLLLKNYALSDDIAFRFSNQHWAEFPLTADKFSRWIHALESHADIINLFMDYETFGEHQWKNTGIFEFLEHLPKQIFSTTCFDFCLPQEVAARYPIRGDFNIPTFYSWADSERDLSAWMGNEMQLEALERIYSLESRVLELDHPPIYATWCSLLTSDHFYYMSTKSLADGNVHQYFSHYETPYDAYINYQNVVKDFEQRLNG